MAEEQDLKRRVAAAVIKEAGHGIVEWESEDILLLHGHGKERPDFIIDTVNQSSCFEDGWQLEKVETANAKYRLIRI